MGLRQKRGPYLIRIYREASLLGMKEARDQSFIHATNPQRMRPSIHLQPTHPFNARLRST